MTLHDAYAPSSRWRKKFPWLFVAQLWIFFFVLFCFCSVGGAWWVSGRLHLKLPRHPLCGNCRWAVECVTSHSMFFCFSLSLCTHLFVLWLGTCSPACSRGLEEVTRLLSLPPSYSLHTPLSCSLALFFFLSLHFPLSLLLLLCFMSLCQWHLLADWISVN